MGNFLSAIYAYLAFLFGRSNTPEAPIAIPLNDLPHHTVASPLSLEVGSAVPESHSRAIYARCNFWCFHVLRRIFVVLRKCLRIVGGLLKFCAWFVLCDIILAGIVRIVALVLNGTVVFNYENFGEPIRSTRSAPGF